MCQSREQKIVQRIARPFFQYTTSKRKRNSDFRFVLFCNNTGGIPNFDFWQEG